jgi:hypothetical protein
MENDPVRTVRVRRSGEELAELLRDYWTPTTGKSPTTSPSSSRLPYPAFSTISNAESSARIICKHTTQTVEKKWRDDVHFRKSRSSIQCQADEAGSTRKRNLLR